MAKHSSKDVVFLVDGFNILGAKPQGLRSKVGVVTERSDGLGDGWHEHSPTGDRFAELAQEGAFFNTAAGNIHEALKDPSSDPNGPARIACVGFAGNVIGRTFTGFEGAIQGEYEVLSTRGALQRANATYMVSGAAEEGVILHEHSTETADDSTEDESVDGGAQSADGGSGYLEVEEITLGGHTGALVTLRDSTDAVVFADLGAFAVVTARGAQRIEVAGTVERYLAQSLDFQGAGAGPSIKYFAGFARN